MYTAVESGAKTTSVYSGNVLVVEDNQVNQMIITKILADSGLKVSIAVNGAEAVEQVKSNDYALILMDLEMPILGGIAATKLIREQKLTQAPILALTAHDNLATRRLCKEAKMNGYLIKPLNMESLRPQLDKYLT